jgi:hypothetical protein
MFMWEIRFRSVVTRCEYTEGGILVARHTGGFGHGEAAHIVPKLASAYAHGIVERYDGALTMFSQDAHAPSYRVPDIPWVLIVRPDQYPQAVDYCAFLATCGVLRTAWLPEHLPVALQWCLSQVRPVEAALEPGRKSIPVLPRSVPLLDVQREWHSAANQDSLPRLKSQAGLAQRL